MKNLTIRTRILLGFSVVIAIEIAAILFFATILVGVNEQVKGLIGIENLVEADRDAYQSHLAILTRITGSVPSGDEADKANKDAILSNHGQVKERFGTFRETYQPASTEDKAALAGFYEIFDKTYADVGKALESMLQGLGDERTGIEFYRQVYLPAFSALRSSIDEMTNITYEHAITQNKNISEIINNIPGFVGTGLVILSVLTIGLAILITASISRQINVATKELGSSSGQIATASQHLSRSSQDIASGAIEQASSIEETSSSMEELASMVKQNAINAKEASILADTTAEASDNGFKQMESMLAAMKTIDDGSKQIRKIMKVIDDIAFQTNILALNAAVEAARAGEAGLGFAVVADEVKNLANRSAAAARETADMIEESMTRTSEGLHIAEDMAAVFRNILNNARKLAEMSREVETASRQQDIGIDQVNKAILQFDEVVQSNATTAEETAAAATELQTQVDTLESLVGKLQVIVLGHKAGQHKEAAKAAGQPEPGPRPAPPQKQLPRSTSGEQKEANRKKIQLIPFEDDEEL